jgi:group II intron reverse transcriptase/maturase
MLTGLQYLDLIRERGRRGLDLERVYRNIQRPDLFLLAYGKLYANQGATTPGTDPKDTVDGMSLARVDTILQALAGGSYRWRPTRRTYIDKANGKKRPLSIPGWQDKLTQEVLRRVLEAYYEPQFSDHSHGFRPGRGCHTALTEIAIHWKGTRWFIEGDIKGCFDHIDQTVLLNILREKIKDNRLLKLIRHMLAAGYIQDWKYHRTWSGTPQGGVISPLLANIYLNKLDQFVEEVLLPKYNRGQRRRQNPEYSRHLTARYRAKLKGDREKQVYHHQLSKTVPALDPLDPNYRRLRYIRYADDFLLGFEGTRQEAEAIKQELKRFLAETLKLEMSDEKTLITHAGTGKARFLGYDVMVAWDNSHRANGKRSINGHIMLRVPADVQHAWLFRYVNKGKPDRRPSLIHLSDYDIVMKFESEVRGLTNYYQMAANVGRLYSVKHMALASLAHTLANKHKRRVTWAYRKYRTIHENGLMGMKTVVEREGKPPLIAKFGATPIRYRRLVKRLEDNKPWDIDGPPARGTSSQLIDRLLAQECELCGSTAQVEVHHIRRLSDVVNQYRRKEKPVWVVRMIKIRRKTLVVCKKCHHDIHAGIYDGNPVRSHRRAG